MVVTTILAHRPRSTGAADTVRREISVRSEQEIADAVRHAADTGSTLRAVGALGSKNDCNRTRGTVLRTDGLDRVLNVDGSHVTVEAGITIRALADELERRGLAIPTPGEWGGATVAGALSTGTHGGSLVHGIFATSVHSMRLVTGTGERVTLERGDPRLSVAALSLGALGVISAVTFTCEPAFHLWMSTRSSRFDDFTAEHGELAERHEFFSAIWSHRCNRVVTYVADRVEPPPFVVPRPRRYSPTSFVASLADRKLGVDLFRDQWFTHDFVDSWSNVLVPIVSNPHRAPVLGRVTRGWWEVEFAVPFEAGESTLTELSDFLRCRDAPLSNPVGIRPTAADGFALSPCRGRPVLWIALHFRPDRSPAFTRDLRAFLADHDALCHWGKSPGLSPDAIPTRCPGWQEFSRLRRTMDPHGVFDCPYLERIP